MFGMELETSNAAFAGYPFDEVARILREVATRVEDGERRGVLRDINGNLVGSFNLTEEE